MPHRELGWALVARVRLRASRSTMPPASPRAASLSRIRDSSAERNLAPYASTTEPGSETNWTLAWMKPGST